VFEEKPRLQVCAFKLVQSSFPGNLVRDPAVCLSSGIMAETNVPCKGQADRSLGINLGGYDTMQATSYVFFRTETF
jgi:hypothetical protein